MSLTIHNGMITNSSRKYTVSEYIENNVFAYHHDDMIIVHHVLEMPPYMDIDVTDPACIYPTDLEGHIAELLKVGYLQPDPVAEEAPTPVEEEPTPEPAEEFEAPIIDEKKLEKLEPSELSLPEFLNHKDDTLEYSFSNKSVSGMRIFKFKNSLKNLTLRLPDSHYNRLSQAYMDLEPASIKDDYYTIRMKSLKDIALTRNMEDIRVTVRIADNIGIPYRVNLTPLRDKRNINIFDNHVNVRITLSNDEFEELREAYKSNDSLTIEKENYVFELRANNEACIKFSSSSNRKKESKGELVFEKKIIDKVFP